MKVVQADPMFRGLTEVEVTNALDRVDRTRKIFRPGHLKSEADFRAAMAHVTVDEALIATEVWMLESAYVQNIAAHFDKHGTMPVDKAWFLRPGCPIEVTALDLAKKEIEAAVTGARPRGEISSIQ